MALYYISRALAALGSLILLISLPLAPFEGVDSLWDWMEPRSHWLLLLFALAAGALAVLSLFVQPALTLLAAAALGFVAFGMTVWIPVDAAFNDLAPNLSPGALFGPFGSLLIAAGALLGVAGTGVGAAVLAVTPESTRPRRPAPAPYGTQPGSAQPVVPPPPVAPQPGSAQPVVSPPPVAPQPGSAQPVVSPPPVASQPSPPPPSPAAPEPSPPAPEPSPPEAGWYPDPAGKARLRYWDGEAWSEHISD